MLKHEDTPCTAGETADSGCFLSVVIPVYNEEENLDILHGRIVSALEPLNIKYEIIYVDDGSTDASGAKLQEIVGRDNNTVAIQFRRNFGQTAAMSAGIDHANGEVIVFVDADLQNDPADIPRLLDKLNEGYDVVSGWRRDRQDNWLLRKAPSFVANRIISRSVGVPLRDYGCTLKAYRREFLQSIRLYGQMHRFIPAFARSVGASVTEVAVNHFPRVHGKSHYGLGRTFRVILDLFTVIFLNRFSGNPIYLFGGAGLVLIGLSFVSGVVMVVQKALSGVSLIQTPLLLLSSMLFILGFFSILMGLNAELLIRTYHESQGKPTYIIRRTFKREQ